MKIGYARVSTREQNSASQRQLLLEAGCVEIYIDEGVSGKTATRPELDKALARLRPGDILVITRLSRLFRGLKHLISLAGELRERGVDLKVTQQDIDTSTSTGRLMFHLLGAFDEFTRELIVVPRRAWPRPPTAVAVDDGVVRQAGHEPGRSVYQSGRTLPPTSRRGLERDSRPSPRRLGDVWRRSRLMLFDDLSVPFLDNLQASRRVAAGPGRTES